MSTEANRIDGSGGQLRASAGDLMTNITAVRAIALAGFEEQQDRNNRSQRDDWVSVGPLHVDVPPYAGAFLPVLFMALYALHIVLRETLDIATGNAVLLVGIVTWDTQIERINAGRGHGYRDCYRPWIWIRRKNVSAQGNQVVDPLPSYRRGSHFLAQVEWHVALLCLYLGAWDVREQLPLWPQSHQHTLADLEQAHSLQLPPSIGLLQIARAAGIDHGWEIGSDSPYIATLDIGATLIRKGSPKLAGISLKPHVQIVTAESDDRIIERLELERRYLLEAEGHHAIADRSLLGKDTGGNLEFFSSGARLPAHLTSPTLIGDYCGRLVEVAVETTISTAIDRVGATMKLNQQEANLLWRHGVWMRLIDLDITIPLELRMPLRLGGRGIANALSQELFGEELS